MDFCYYDKLLEQIRFQRLDSNTLFGPINCLIQKELLQSEKVRFFITVGLDTSRLSQLWDNYSMYQDGCVMVNFDPNFHVTDTTNKFFYENLENLRKILSRVMSEDSSSQQRLKRLIKNDPFTLRTIYSGDWGVQIRYLLDIAIIFKMASKYGKTLIVSKNGNDNRLVSFLISFQLIQNPRIPTLDVFKFIKVQRPSIHDLTIQFIKLCDSLNGNSVNEPTRDKQCRKLEQPDYSSKRTCI